MSISLIVLIVAIIFLIIVLILPSSSSSEKEYPEELPDVLKSITIMRKKGWDWFVRPDGKIDGVVVDDDEYFHENLGKHRRKWVYWGLDGKKREEDRYMWNPTTQGLDDLRAVSGGNGNIVMTMRKSHAKEPDQGEKEPILIGKQARDRVDIEETFTAIKEELVRTVEGLQAKEEDYKETARKYTNAQEKIEELQDENQEYFETISDQSKLIDRLKSENEDLEAELEEKKSQLEKKREEIRRIEEEVDTTLEKQRERGEKKTEAEEARA